MLTIILYHSVDCEKCPHKGVIFAEVFYDKVLISNCHMELNGGCSFKRSNLFVFLVFFSVDIYTRKTLPIALQVIHLWEKH
jgi:hypothetical protein